MRQKKSARQLREAAIAHYGGHCSCCGESRYEFLTIDHIENDGAEHRRTVVSSRSICFWLKQNGYPEGFQVLCWNCNTAKHFHGGCPHQAA